MKWIMCNDYMIMILVIIQFNNLFINILQSYLVISSKDYTPESWAVSCIGDTALSLLRPVYVMFYICIISFIIYNIKICIQYSRLLIISHCSSWSWWWKMRQKIKKWLPTQLALEGLTVCSLCTLGWQDELPQHSYMMLLCQCCLKMFLNSSSRI